MSRNNLIKRQRNISNWLKTMMQPNRYDYLACWFIVICSVDASFGVNGTLVILGRSPNLQRGKIQLQSDGAEMKYRHLHLETITAK